MPRRAAKKTVHDRMYYREGRGWYLDLRDLGRGRLALIDRGRGERAACENEDRAFEIAKKVMEMHGEDPTLEAFADHHLTQKGQRRRKGTVERDRISLEQIGSWASGRLGREPRLSDVTKRFVLDYMAWRGPRVAAKTLAHELHALSNLMKRAVGRDLVLLNPVPKAKEVEGFEIVAARLPEWYEVGEAARLLRACAELDSYRPLLPRHPIVATSLLSGARPGETLGFRVQDFDFSRGVVHIRANEYRLLKRNWHERDVPLWPQLADIVGQYIERAKPRDLLFANPKTGKPYEKIRYSLKTAHKRARIFKQPRLYNCRHTYCATRLQTLDGGKPVSPYTVMEEMGHRDLTLIERVYGHLQKDRQRLAVVEYREATVTELRQAQGA